MGAAERRHACGGGKILVHLRYGGIEQQPRLVAHHSAPEGGPCGARVEAIAFDQEFFERSGRRAPPFRAGGEAHFEPAAPEKPLAAVPALAALHPRRKVWQPHREARDGDCERVRRVEAEEPDPGAVSRMRHVGAEVELVKIRQGRQSPEPPLAQRERRHRYPRASLELVDREARMHEPRQLRRRHAPVEEKEIAPVLVADDQRSCARRHALRALAASSFGCTGFTRASRPS